MELWIRSQDKMILTKAEKIGAYYTMNKKGEIRVNTDSEISLSIGHYSTMKRALEVLDEIQSKIKQQFLCKPNPTLSCKSIEKAEDILNLKYKQDFIMELPSIDIEPINISTIVYEMPEK